MYWMRWMIEHSERESLDWLSRFERLLRWRARRIGPGGLWSNLCYCMLMRWPRQGPQGLSHPAASTVLCQDIA